MKPTGAARRRGAARRGDASKRPDSPGRHPAPASSSIARRARSPTPPRASTRASASHLVLIPSYNTGPQLLATVQAAREHWNPVWVVVDGSTDGSGEAVQRLAASDPGLEVLLLPSNVGKGAAVLHGLARAADVGFSHALTMDSDGQHPAELIPSFMQASMRRPATMVLGRPVFDASAPWVRVRGRQISNGWTRLETLGAAIDDSLCGFRVYPVADLVAVMRGQRWMRRFDFDTEAVVRLAWRGVTPVNLAAPVRYLSASDGGVSHFRYGRDNLLLTWMHIRLMTGFLLRLPSLTWRRAKKRPPFDA